MKRGQSYGHPAVPELNQPRSVLFQGVCAERDQQWLTRVCVTHFPLLNRSLRVTSGPTQSAVAVVSGYLYCKKASSIPVLFTGSDNSCSMPLNPLPGNKM